jgi:hypothetical protein
MLVVAPCSFDAAKYAVMHWHYSQAMPAGKLVKYGIWERKRFIGVLTFSRGASAPLIVTMERKYGVRVTEWAELTRVAMDRHDVEVTRVVAEAIRLLKQSNPGLRLLISFADPNRGHHGGIYQGGNWVYVGQTQAEGKYDYWHKGRWRVERSLRRIMSGEQIRSLPRRYSGGKYRYLMPLDRQMRRRVMREALPYPARADEGSEASRPVTDREG